MQNPQHFMPDIIGLLTHYRPEHVKYLEDGTMATPVGFFRTAYNAERDVFALLYARNYEDLAHEDVPDPQDSSKLIQRIKYPERLLCIATKDREQSWNKLHDDIAEPNQPDLSYFGYAVQRAMQYFPRALYREAVLHRIGDNYLSKLFGYMPEPADLEGAQQRIGFHSRMNGVNEASFMPLGEFHAPQLGLRRMLGQTSERILKIPVQDAAGSEPRIQEIFSSDQIAPLVLADAAIVIDAIWRGKNPSDMGVAVALTRTQEIIMQQVSAARELVVNPRALVRGAVRKAIDFSDVASMAILYALDQLLPEHEIPKWISHGGRHLVDKPRRGIISCVSELAELFMLPKVGELKNYAWHHPSVTRESYRFDRAGIQPTGEFLFYNWLVSHFRAPYIATVDYYGQFEDVKHMQSAAQVEAVKVSVSNGLVHVYLPVRDELFSFYQNPSHAPYQRQLPEGYERFFQADKVILTRAYRYDGRMEYLGFDEFRGRLPINLAPHILSGLAQPSVPPARIAARPSSAVVVAAAKDGIHQRIA